MRKKQLLLLTLVLVAFVSSAQQNEKLWYKKPAAVWTEALPVGNGRLGAMVFGRIGEELIQLNESTLWSGGPVPQRINPGVYQYLPQIRKTCELMHGRMGVESELAKGARFWIELQPGD